MKTNRLLGWCATNLCLPGHSILVDPHIPTAALRAANPVSGKDPLNWVVHFSSPQTSWEFEERTQTHRFAHKLHAKHNTGAHTLCKHEHGIPTARYTYPKYVLLLEPSESLLVWILPLRHVTKLETWFPLSANLIDLICQRNSIVSEIFFLFKIADASVSEWIKA